MKIMANKEMSFCSEQICKYLAYTQAELNIIYINICLTKNYVQKSDKMLSETVKPTLLYLVIIKDQVQSCLQY